MLLDAMAEDGLPIGGRFTSGGRSGCWRRWASGSIFPLRARPARLTICLCLAAHRACGLAGGRGALCRALFALPAFLLGSQNGEVAHGDLAAGLRADEHFLLERVLRPNGKQCQARGYASMLSQHIKNPNRAKPPQHDHQAPIKDDIRPEALKQGAERTLSGLCAVHHHPTRATRCARRAQAGPSPHAACHAPARPQPGGGLQEMRPRGGRRHRQISIPMAIRRSMTRWCASRRISRCAIRWWRARAISAMSTAITPPRCATPKAA